MQRKALQASLKAAYEEIPPCVVCPRCGIPLAKADGHFHHPAGRRKDAYVFGFIMHPHCHEATHADGKSAEAAGLLLPGRNSKVLTLAAATELVLKQKFPALYSLDILQQFSLTKP